MLRTKYFRWTTGATLYAKARPLATATWSDGIITGTENGATGEYSFDVGAPEYELFQQAGGSPAATDTPVGYFDSAELSAESSSAGVPVNAVSFGGRLNALTLPTLPFVSIAGSYSFATWFRTKGSVSSDMGVLFEYYTSLFNRQTARIAPGSGEGRIRLGIYDGSYSFLQSERAGLFDGKWHHMVMTMDSGAMGIYVDGYESGTSAISSGAISDAKQIGYNKANSLACYQLQDDIRFYDRVLTSSECLKIFRHGRDDKREREAVVTDYQARWQPSGVTGDPVPDLSPNGYDLTWANYDRKALVRSNNIDHSNKIQSIYAIGNSLTADTQARQIAKQGDWVVNSSEGIQYHLANPNTGTDFSSYVWSEALNNRNYDVLCIQPYPLGQTIVQDVADMQTWIDLQPNATILIHEGWTSQVGSNNGNAFSAALTTLCAHSDACFDEYVRQVSLANPGRTVLRSNTLKAIEQIRLDELAGIAQVSLAGVGGAVNLFRDGLHLHFTQGRYLAHHCLRRALGIKEIYRGYPFTDEPTLGSADPVVMDYLDTVVDRVFAADPVQANLVSILGSNLTETTKGRIAGNQSIFFGNEDAESLKIQDDVGGDDGQTPIVDTAELATALGSYLARLYASSDGSKQPTDVTLYRGTTWRIPLDVLPDTWSRIEFTIRSDRSQLQSESLVHIIVTNPADAAADGLKVFNGSVPADATDGEITLPSDASLPAIAIVDAHVSAELKCEGEYCYDAKIFSGDDVDLLAKGRAFVELDVTRTAAA